MVSSYGVSVYGLYVLFLRSMAAREPVSYHYIAPSDRGSILMVADAISCRDNEAR
jgi:hypothetical protein